MGEGSQREKGRGKKQAEGWRQGAWKCFPLESKCTLMAQPEWKALERQPLRSTLWLTLTHVYTHTHSHSRTRVAALKALLWLSLICKLAMRCVSCLCILAIIIILKNKIPIRWWCCCCRFCCRCHPSSPNYHTWGLSRGQRQQQTTITTTTAIWSQLLLASFNCCDQSKPNWIMPTTRRISWMTM